jgi:hypothetical protein
MLNMKVSKKIKLFIVILGVPVLILSLLLLFSPVRLNMSFFLGDSDIMFCGGKGYRGDYFISGLECCGTKKFWNVGPTIMPGPNSYDCE